MTRYEVKKVFGIIKARPIKKVSSFLGMLNVYVLDEDKCWHYALSCSKATFLKYKKMYSLNVVEE